MSIFKELLDEVATILRTLNLEGIGADEIVVRKVPHDGETMFHGITVHPVRERMGRGTNERDDIGYGVGITFVENNDTTVFDHLGRWLDWRETVRRRFIEENCVDGISLSFNVKVEHGDVFDDRLMFRTNYDVGSLVLRCWVREVREVGIRMPVITASAVVLAPTVS